VLELLCQWHSATIHGSPGDWVFVSPYTKGKRPFWPAQMMKKHIKPAALELGLPNIGWHSFRHTVSAWGKEAGLELEEVKTLLRHENLATTSEVYGDLGMEAKRDPAAAGDLRQTAGHTRSVAACTHLVNLCDPYLTQIVFADSRQVQEKNGSSGRTRTYNPPVNSRVLRVPPIDSKGNFDRLRASKPPCLRGLAGSLADGFPSRSSWVSQAFAANH